MSKHTPGPWKTSGHDIVTEANPKLFIAFTYSPRRFADDLHDPEHEANARLIAAAPELLEALKDMTPRYMPPVDAPCHRGIVSQSKCLFCRRIAAAITAIQKAGGGE